MASLTDGNTLLAGANGDLLDTPFNDRTTAGSTGAFAGSRFDSIELQSLGTTSSCH